MPVVKGSLPMDVEIKLDNQYKTPKVVIYAARIDDDINALANRIAAAGRDNLIAYVEQQALIIKPEQVFRIYAQGKKVYVRMEGQTATLRATLQELEQQFEGVLVRVSNSEIVNFEHVKSLDLSMGGSISMRLANGDTAFVSRRYMKRIKDYLGL